MMKKTSLFVLMFSIVFGLAGSLVIGAPSAFAADQVKWYGYEEGMALARKDPEMAALLEDIKEPHEHVHASGMEIKKMWQQ